MTIEQRVSTEERGLRHPPGRGTWVQVEIPDGQLVRIPLRGNRNAVVGRLDGAEFVYVEKYEGLNSRRISDYAKDEKINSRRAPWAGRIRCRRG